MRKEFKASPTVGKFLKSDAFIRAIKGPLGSGKSVGCCMDIALRAAGQEPNGAGVRKTRFVVIRNTAQQLRDTSLKTWMDWFPEGEAGIWRATDKTFKLRIPGPPTEKFPGGTKIESDILFRALDTPDDQRNLLSLELTGGWINEFREVPFEVLLALTGRVGRYPSKSDGPGCTWQGVIMDTNPPDMDSPYYRLFMNPSDEDEFVGGKELYEQPSGLDPRAENLENLPGGVDYYHRMLSTAKAEGKDQSWIDVHVHGKWGFVMDGRAVYGDAFDHDTHVSKVPLVPVKHRPIVIGADFGLTPAACWGQVDAFGRWLILGEFVTEDMAADEFGKALHRYLVDRYGMTTPLMYGDPAGQQRSQVDKRSVFDAIRQAGFDIRASPEQSPSIRIASVKSPLNRLVSGGPGFLIDPSCTMLIQGFQGGYQYRRMKVSGERYTEKPDKNKYSHIHDALQYLMATFEGDAIKGGRRREWPEDSDIRSPHPGEVMQMDSNWSVWE